MRRAAGCSTFLAPLITLLILAGCSEHRDRTTKSIAIGDLAHSEASAADQERVSINAWVTAIDSRSHSIYLQDSSGAVRVRYSRSILLPKIGDYVNATGIAVGGFPSPTLVNPSFQVRTPAAGELPPVADTVTLNDLLSGRSQYRLCRISGVVHGVAVESSNHPTVKLVSDGQLINVPIPDLDDTRTREFRDSLSSWEGVPDVTFDLAGHVTEITLCSARLDSVQILEPAPPTKHIPFLTIADLLRRPPGNWQEHQVRVKGTIELGRSGDGFAIRDGASAIPVQTVLSNSLPVGVVVNATGFVSYSNNDLALDDATVSPIESQGHSALVIRTVRDIQRMKAETAALGLPVDLTGVVTFYEPVGKGLFVEDNTGGIYVQLSNQFSLNLNVGDRVRVLGQTDPDDYATSIKRGSVKLLSGKQRLPKPVADYDRIFSGAEDSNWSQLTGVVQRVDNSSEIPTLYIHSGNEWFRALVAKTKALPQSLVDARVSVRGVCGSRYNGMRQFLGVQMFVPSIAYVSVTDQRSVTSVPVVQSIRRLLEYSPQMAIGRRVRVRGTVTSTALRGPTTLQDFSGSLSVSDHQPVRLAPGDVVEATGFVRIGSLTPVLENAELSPRLGTKTVRAMVLSPEKLVQKRVANTLVQVDAQLVDSLNSIDAQILTLQADGFTFQATAPNDVFLPGLERGALLRVTGVSLFSADSGQDDGSSHFRILLRSPSDVVVVRKAPWLTPRRTLELSGSVVLFAAVSLLWIIVLRRQVKRQTAIINEKLSREEALREEAQQANRSKSEFLANISHEIRTPMNGVLGMTDLALRSELDPDVRDYLTVAHSSGEQLLDLLNDILDMSKIEAGLLDLEKTTFDPNEVAGEVAKTLAKRAHEQGLELLVDVDACVPEGLLGDPYRFRQVLLNLLGNAVKFTASGEVLLKIGCERLTSSDCILKCSVVDTGIGIDPEKIGAIFSAFTQADGSTTRKYGGTGLGLSICKQLVTIMGGEIGVESSPGQGSTFWFTLPLALAEVHREKLLNLDSLRDLRVLITEDNATSSRILRSAVEGWGMKATCASSAAEAVVAADSALRRGEPFSLFLIDCQMADLDGFDLVARLREKDLVRGAALIMLISLDATQAARCRAMGLNRHVVKPVARAELLTAVLSCFAGEGKTAKHTRQSDPSQSALPLKILLAEDNRTNQILARRLLERSGHSVSIAETGQAAVDAVQKELFDVILMDVQMPVMDGYEAAVRIRSLEKPEARDIPIIALTAHAMEADRQRCIDCGMNDFLTKPLSTELLLTRLDSIARAKRPFPAEAPISQT